MMSKVVCVPNIAIYPSKVVQYNTFENVRRTYRNTGGLKLNKPDGSLSQKASVRLKNAISWLTHLSKWADVQDKNLKKKFKFKINFITLTLPSPQVKEIRLPCGFVVPYKDYPKVWPAVNLGFAKCELIMSDKEIKDSFLNQFLTEIRHRYKVKHYVWRAETQANGNLHFHITLNKYIYHSELRSVWNRILNKSDFIQNYHKKFAGISFEKYCEIADPMKNKSNKKLAKAYQYGMNTNWLNPNSTDVHSVKAVRNLEAYLSEYFTKTDSTRRLVKGYLWRLSESLSRLKHAHAVLDSGLEMELEYFQKTFKDKFKEFDYASILYVPMQFLFNLYNKSRIVAYFEAYKNESLKLNPIPI